MSGFPVGTGRFVAQFLLSGVPVGHSKTYSGPDDGTLFDIVLGGPFDSWGFVPKVTDLPNLTLQIYGRMDGIPSLNVFAIDAVTVEANLITGAPTNRPASPVMQTKILRRRR